MDGVVGRRNVRKLALDGAPLRVRSNGRKGHAPVRAGARRDGGRSQLARRPCAHLAPRPASALAVPRRNDGRVVPLRLRLRAGAGRRHGRLEVGDVPHSTPRHRVRAAPARDGGRPLRVRAPPARPGHARRVVRAGGAHLPGDDHRPRARAVPRRAAPGHRGAVSGPDVRPRSRVPGVPRLPGAGPAGVEPGVRAVLAAGAAADGRARPGAHLVAGDADPVGDQPAVPGRVGAVGARPVAVRPRGDQPVPVPGRDPLRPGGRRADRPRVGVRAPARRGGGRRRRRASGGPQRVRRRAVGRRRGSGGGGRGAPRALPGVGSGHGRGGGRRRPS